MTSVYIAPTLQDAIGATNYADDLGGGKVGVDYGSGTNGNTTTPVVIAVAHDHASASSNALIYFEELSPGVGETYDGSFTPSGDFARLLSWPPDGGVEVEFDWFAGTAFAEVLEPGNMNLEANAVQIPAESMAYDVVGTTTQPSTPVDGEIFPIGDAGKATTGEGAEFKCQLAVPTTELVVGFLEWDMVVVLEFVS